MFKRIGVMTSGGDCAGMNAAVRSVIRTCLYEGVTPFAIYRGYLGILDKNFKKMEARDASGFISRGGTALQTARCPEFKNDDVQERGIANLREAGIEGLVVIGGDGSLTGAHALAQKGFPVIGVPASIDNDIFGTDMSIGVDTAQNIIMQSLDKLKDTASSHDRCFIVEVMGRNCGYLALVSSLATGAEIALIPEMPYDIERIRALLKRRFDEGRTNSLVVVAEGVDSAYNIDKMLKGTIGYDTRITVLGHIQRGGSPTVFDRVLASRMGNEAVTALLAGESDKMVGQIRSKMVLQELETVLKTPRKIETSLLELAEALDKK